MTLGMYFQQGSITWQSRRKMKALGQNEDTVLGRVHCTVLIIGQVVRKGSIAFEEAFEPLLPG